MNNHLSVSGSIVLYKNKEDVLQAIHSFLNSPLTTKLFLIDNSPTRVLENFLQQEISDERVEYIFNNKNIGYGAAHNIALQRSVQQQYPYHFILNPDVKFAPNVISDICKYMEANAEVGLVMPKILYENGDIQYLCKLLPSPFDLFIRRFLPASLIRKRTNKFELRQTGYNRIMEVPFLSGCFMALRKKAIEQCGMFDEGFFMYAEDIDFSRRIHQKFKTIYYPFVSVVHGYKAASYKEWKMLKLHTLSIIRYFNKWGWFFDTERRKVNAETLKALKNKEDRYL